MTEGPIKAFDRETNRTVLVTPIIIQPGEQAPCALPNAGRTPAEYLRLVLAGESEYITWDINLTDKPIVIYRGEWGDTGLPGGYWWHKHLRFEEERRLD
jgi:hypothetical protein